MNKTAYVERKSILLNTTFRIDSTGKGYFIEGDKKYTREEFNRKYPLPVSFVNANRRNCDGTKAFLYVE